MFSNVDALRGARNQLFEMVGEKRWKRVALIALFIALVWCFADWISGSLEANYWHDLICLLLAIVIERLVPWGKEGTH